VLKLRGITHFSFSLILASYSKYSCEKGIVWC